MDMQKLNYDLIQAFNDLYYKNLLFSAQLCGDEMHITKAKDEDGLAADNLNEFAYPFKKNKKTYLLRSSDLKLLPIRVDKYEKISLGGKAYHLVTSARPAGFGSEMCYPSVKDFVTSFCDYKHSDPDDFLLWKLVSIVSYLKRVNVRVASTPAFGKDSVLRVLNLLLGDVGMVVNPTIAKMEFLLTNKVVLTNEVAGIKTEDEDNLSQYYLACGDFSNVYEKRSMATLKGTHDTYNINQLSNVVCYNDISCYSPKKQLRYFDHMFQKAIQERFFPFKFSGKVLEPFGAVLNAEKTAEENKPYYISIIKTLKHLEDNFDSMLHHYKPIEHPFTDRFSRNWETICFMIDLYSDSQEEYERLCKLALKKHHAYAKMLNGERDDKLNQYEKDLKKGTVTKSPFDNYEQKSDYTEDII